MTPFPNHHHNDDVDDDAKWHWSNGPFLYRIGIRLHHDIQADCTDELDNGVTELGQEYMGCIQDILNGVSDDENDPIAKRELGARERAVWPLYPTLRFTIACTALQCANNTGTEWEWWSRWCDSIAGKNVSWKRVLNRTIKHNKYLHFRWSEWIEKFYKMICYGNTGPWRHDIIVFGCGLCEATLESIMRGLAPELGSPPHSIRFDALPFRPDPSGPYRPWALDPFDDSKNT
jgi:hypothetical protein